MNTHRAAAGLLWMLAAPACGIASDAASPLQGMEFLAGACWQAETELGSREEHCYEWLPGHQHLRDRFTVSGKRDVVQGEVLYTREPGSDQIRYVYWDLLGGFRQGLVQSDSGALIFGGETYISEHGVEEQRQRWYPAGNRGMLQVTEVLRDGEWQKLERQRWTISRQLDVPESSLRYAELHIFKPFLGDWVPDPSDPALRHNPQVRDRVVMSLRLAPGGHLVRVYEGFNRQSDPQAAALEGIAIANPGTNHIDFIASTRFGWTFQGRYLAGTEDALERLYTVQYRQGESRIPEPDLPGWTRRFREIYRLQSDQRLSVQLDIDRDGQWVPWGPNQGRFNLVRAQRAQ